MAERASIYQLCQLGVETVYGTDVAATKKLQSLGIELGIKTSVKTFRPTGQKYPALAAQGKEWMEGSLSGTPTYSELIYPLSSVLTSATPVSGSGGSYSHTFTPAISSADTPKSFTVEQGDATRAHKSNGVLVNSFGMNFTREEGTLSGSVFGMAIQDDITLSGSAASIELVPIAPDEVSVYVADTAAGLAGATALARPLSVGFEVGNRYLQLWVLDASQSSFVATVEAEPSATVKLKLEADAEGMDLLTQLRSGATKFLRIEATGPLIAGAVCYSFIADFALKVVDVSPFGDEQGVFAIEWSFVVGQDATWGKALEMTVINKQSAL